MNSTEKNPGSLIWRRCNGYLSREEWIQKPCFICGSPYHNAGEQDHVDGWGVLNPNLKKLGIINE